MHSSAHPSSLPPAQASQVPSSLSHARLHGVRTARDSRALSPMQVIQFLLARNYYLTALELLVESQQTGRQDEVPELQVRVLTTCSPKRSRLVLVDSEFLLFTQRFFSDPDRFPAEEVAKHQNANGRMRPISASPPAP